MKSVIIRIAGIAAVVMIVLQYNGVLKERSLAEASILEVYEAAVAAREETSADKPYKDGVYTAEAQGYGGTIEIEAVVENGWLQEITIVSAEKEDAAYLSMAEEIIPEIITNQSADVDTITGATFSSGGIRKAAEEALEKAEK